MSAQRFAAADVGKLSESPAFQHAFTEAMTSRLIDRLQTANKVLERAPVPSALSAATSESQMVTLLIIDHLRTADLPMAASVVESESGLIKKEQADIRGLVAAWQAGVIKRSRVKPTMLEEAMFAGLARLGQMKSIAVQVDRTREEDLDLMLMKVENEHREKMKVELWDETSAKTNWLAGEYGRLKREMETELEHRERIFRDKELQKMKLQERQRFDTKVATIQAEAERLLRSKLKLFRDKETEMKLDAAEQRKHVEGLRVDVERILMNDMTKLDKDRIFFEEEKQKEYQKLKSLDYKLDKRELDLITREKFQEVHKQLNEEAVENTRQGVLHMHKERSALTNRQQLIIDELEEREKELKDKLAKRDAEVEGLHRELRKRELENDDRSKKTSTLREENLKLKDLLNTQLEIGRKKESTIGLYEKRIEGLVDENIKVKDCLQELKRNWILQRDVRPSEGRSNELFKPII